jgi:hypothetical protein
MKYRSIALALVIAFPAATRVFAADPQPNVADILQQIASNVERAEGASLETLYTVVITQYANVQREYLRSSPNSEAQKHLDEITSDTEVNKIYVKRWSIGQRNAERVLEFHIANGRADLTRTGGGGHDVDINRYVRYAEVSSKLGICPPVVQDHIGPSKPGHYSFVSPGETPWGFIHEHLGLSRVNHHELDEENYMGRAFIDMNYALQLLANPGAVKADSDGYLTLQYTSGDAGAALFTSKLDSHQSFLPIEIDSGVDDSRISAERKISYKRIPLRGQPDTFVPGSITATTYLTTDGAHKKMYETAISVRKCEVVSPPASSPIHMSVEQLPQFSEGDLQLLEFSEQGVLDEMAEKEAQRKAQASGYHP